LTLKCGELKTALCASAKETRAGARAWIWWCWTVNQMAAGWIFRESCKARAVRSSLHIADDLDMIQMDNEYQNSKKC